MPTKKPKVVIALSGGVDSSVTAALLKAEGYDCAAVFYELWSDAPKQGKGWENNCCSLEAYRDAQKVARKLGIPLFRANISREFKKIVVDHFLAEYQAGRTPNPCITCNSELRFGLMLERAQKIFNADYLATGHYAVRDHADSWRSDQINNYRKPTHVLLRGVDDQKDQSFFLYSLSHEQLGSVLFPLGGMKKKNVRALAKKLGLPAASKHDSQEVCFIPKGKTGDFLKTKIGATPGRIRNVNGEDLGRHEDIGSLTIGQRKGVGALGLRAHYVVNKDMQAKTVTVSDNRERDGQMLEWIEISEPAFIAGLPQIGAKLTARYRPLQKPFACSVVSHKPFVIKTLEQVPLVAPGQSAVLMDGREVLGGGTVSKIGRCATLERNTRVKHAFKTAHART